MLKKGRKDEQEDEQKIRNTSIKKKTLDIPLNESLRLANWLILDKYH